MEVHGRAETPDHRPLQSLGAGPRSAGPLVGKSICRSTCFSLPVMLDKHAAVAPKGAYCFGCNQPFEGGIPSVKFESDLVPPSDRPELANLYFHPGHLIRYANRRNWTSLAEYIERMGASNF